MAHLGVTTPKRVGQRMKIKYPSKSSNTQIARTKKRYLRQLTRGGNDPLKRRKGLGVPWGLKVEYPKEKKSDWWVMGCRLGNDPVSVCVCVQRSSYQEKDTWGNSLVWVTTPRKEEKDWTYLAGSSWPCGRRRRWAPWAAAATAAGASTPAAAAGRAAARSPCWSGRGAASTPPSSTCWRRNCEKKTTTTTTTKKNHWNHKETTTTKSSLGWSAGVVTHPRGNTPVSSLARVLIAKSTVPLLR